MTGLLEEHLHYLSLRGRTERYAQAIGQVIQQGDEVADLGCGFGILGLQCLKAGASRVWGIDSTAAVDIALQTAARIGMADRYAGIQDSTFRAQLPHPVDVIICDHVGFFGFDYGIIEMLADARRRMLKPGGAVIPARIELSVAGAASDKCRSLRDAWLTDPVPPEFHWVRELSINSKHSGTFTADDLCSGPAMIGSIDLTSDSPDSLSFTTTLGIERDCELDGLVGWFNCELAQGVFMTNSPIDPAGIGRPNVFLPCDGPMPVKAGNTIEVSIKVLHATNVITWTLRNPATGEKQRQSTWKSRILTKADLPTDDTLPLSLNPQGKARQTILNLVDGQHCLADIAQTVAEEYPQIFPDLDTARRFVSRELRRDTEK